MGLLMFWKRTFQHCNVEEKQLALPQQFKPIGIEKILCLYYLVLFTEKAFSLSFYIYFSFFILLFLLFFCFFHFLLLFLCTWKNTCTKSGSNSITKITKSSLPKLGNGRLRGTIQYWFMCLYMCTMIQSINISLSSTVYLGYSPVHGQKLLTHGVVKYCFWPPSL